jgi:hypothetical protein
LFKFFSESGEFKIKTHGALKDFRINECSLNYFYMNKTHENVQICKTCVRLQLTFDLRERQINYLWATKNGPEHEKHAQEE